MIVWCMFVFRRFTFQVQRIRSFYLNFHKHILIFLQALTFTSSSPTATFAHSQLLTPPFTPSHTVSHIHSLPFTYSHSLPHESPHSFPRLTSLYSTTDDVLSLTLTNLHSLVATIPSAWALGNASFNQYKLVGLFLMRIKIFTSLVSGPFKSEIMYIKDVVSLHFSPEVGTSDRISIFRYSDG
jgi:hypothetical protein